MNSNRKGKVGERELAKILREHGYETRRSQQYAGGTEESADIVGLDGIHVECKRVEKLNIDDAMLQAHTDSRLAHRNHINDVKKPAVFHRKNQTTWKVTMYLEDWIELYREWSSSEYLKGKV